MVTTDLHGALNLVAEVLRKQSGDYLRSPCGLFWLRLVPQHDPEDLIRARLRQEGRTLQATESPFLSKCTTYGHSEFRYMHPRATKHILKDDYYDDAW